MNRKFHDRYPSIPTRRGGAHLQGREAVNETALPGGENLGSSRMISTVGTTEHRENKKKKVAEQSINIRTHRSEAIEEFRELLSLDSGIPHYQVLRIALWDYTKLRENMSQVYPLTASQTNEYISKVRQYYSSTNEEVSPLSESESH